MKLLSAAVFVLLVFSAAPSSAVDGACYLFDGDLAICISNVPEEDCEVEPLFAPADNGDGVYFEAGVHCLDLSFDFDGGCVFEEELLGSFCAEIAGDDQDTAEEICEEFDPEGAEYLGDGVFCEAVPTLPTTGIVVFLGVLLATGMWTLRRRAPEGSAA